MKELSVLFEKMKEVIEYKGIRNFCNFVMCGFVENFDLFFKDL